MDSGSYCVKAGFAGQPFPALVVPPVIAEWVDQEDSGTSLYESRELFGREGRSWFVGQEAVAQAEKHPGRMQLRPPPMSDGVVENWDSLEKVTLTVWLH